MIELSVITGPDKGLVFRSRAFEATIGRDTNSDMSLSDPSSSRLHARIVKRERYYEIEDLSSGNGTILNACHIDVPTQLQPGDLIVIGNNTIRFYFKDENPRPLGLETDYRATATLTMTDLQRELAVQRSGDSTDQSFQKRTPKDMAIVYRVAQSLASTRPPGDLYAKITELVLEEFPRADRSTLILSEDVSAKPIVQLTNARHSHIGITDTLYRESLAYSAMVRQESMLIVDPESEHKVKDLSASINKNIRSAICVPLRTQGGLCGVLYADCLTDIRGFDEDDLKTLSVMGLQVSSAVDNFRLYEKLNAEKAALAAANADIKLAQQRLIQSEKLSAVGELAAGLVHDIRNPIQLILGHAQYIQSTIRDTEPAALDKNELLESLTEIERGTHHVNDIVTQLLAFAKQSKPELRATRINDVAMDTMRFLQPETNKNRVKVVTQFDPLMPPVLADPSQLKQVIVNIVINAVQAMPQGGTLTVTTAPFRDQDRDFVSLAFADTGCGMPPDQLQKIFDPFFTTKPDIPGAGGMGLGLAVSYGIIENHGGRILADSEPGRGSCFTILLPAHNVPVINQADDPRATFYGSIRRGLLLNEDMPSHNEYGQDYHAAQVALRPTNESDPQRVKLPSQCSV